MAENTNEFIDEITQVSPNEIITDETTNLITNELQNNIKYLTSLLSSSTKSTNQPSTENLLNYNNNGNRVSSNGGTFETFENKNSWTAVQDNAVVNDSKIVNSPINLLIYSGLASTIESGSNSNSWLEREFYIPPQLRGNEFVFAVKGTGVTSISESSTGINNEYAYCNSSTIPGVSAVAISGDCAARYEDIVIDVKGSDNIVSTTRVMGPWPQFKQYANSNWGPAYRTAFVSFRVSVNTSSVKIRIIRTKLDGAVAFSNMLLVALPSPFETYKYNNIDINEIYDFQNNILKFNSTTLNCRHVAETVADSKLSNIITKEQMLYILQYNKDIQFDWDQTSGPRLIDVDNNLSDSPKIHAFEFDPGFTRYIHFNVRSDGPNPGTACIAFNYFITENEFSGTITCSNPYTPNISGTVVYPFIDCPSGDNTCYEQHTNMHQYADTQNDYCKFIKLDVFYKTVNPGDPANVDFALFNKISYLVAIPINLISNARLGYFEIYNDFFKEIRNNRGAITYFTISRDGSNPLDTFAGNFLIGPTTISLNNPPDDMPAPNTYTIRIDDC